MKNIKNHIKALLIGMLVVSLMIVSMVILMSIALPHIQYIVPILLFLLMSYILGSEIVKK